MSEKTLLQVVRREADRRATPDQERFRYLITQIESVRKARTTWDKTVDTFRRADSERLRPLRLALRTATRETVLVIDRLLAQKGWSRADQEALTLILRSTAEAVLEADPNDQETRDAYDRHSNRAFDQEKQDELDVLKEQAKAHLGLDLDDEEIRSEEDLIQRVYEHMAEREREEEESRRERARGRRKSAEQQRAEDRAGAAKRFLRELYRKLASAVHPDREADAERRAEKNELMQRINRAYATNDLLTLLEAQMRLEQIDPEHVARLSGERLKHYNKLLAEQLEGLKSELRRLEEAFRMDHGLPYNRKLTPQALTLLTQERMREIRTHIARQKHFLEVLATKTATKRWLKEQRRFEDDWLDE